MPRISAARAALLKTLYTAKGERRLPSTKALDAALSAMKPAVLEKLFEFDLPSPLYFLPTAEFVKALAAQLRELGVKRVVEVGAGDGFLSRALAKAAPGLEIHATDSGAWVTPEARMSAAEKRKLKGVEVPGLALGAGVEKLPAKAAIAKYRPDLVLAAWLPPGDALEKLIRADVRYVLDIGAAGGVTPGAWNWRFAHEFLEGLEAFARCRLDVRPRKERHSRITLYFGKKHPEFAVERVREGDWLWQYRPTGT